MTSVIVMPLQPPFDRDGIMIFRFNGFPPLAISRADSELIADMLEADPDEMIGRMLKIERVDNERIRISVVPS